MELGNVEQLFNRAVNGGGYKTSVVQPLFAPVLTNCAVGTAGANWKAISAAAAASPTILLNYMLSGNFARGSGSGLKGIPSFRLRLAARLVDTTGDLSGQVASALLLKGSARFHSPVVSKSTGLESDGTTGDVASAAATLVCQDTVQGNDFSVGATPPILVDGKFEKIRIYEYDPLAGLTAAQRALLTPETLMQITISTSIAVPANNRLDIFGMTAEERRHVGLWSILRRCEH